MKNMTDNDFCKAMLEAILTQGTFLDFVRALPARAYIKDAGGRFIIANQAVADFVGVQSPKEVVGKTDFDFFPKEAAEKYSADEKKIMESGQPLLNKEEPKPDNTGRQRKIYISKFPIRDNTGKVIGILGFSIDLTDQQLAEEKYHGERNHLRAIIDALPDYIYAKDLKSRFTLSNAIHAQHMGIKSPDELIGKTDFDFYSKDVANSFFADEQEIIRTGKPLINKDEINSTLHGNTARVLTSKTPIRDAQGKITGIVGVGHDITSMSKMERNLGQVSSKLGETLEELKQTQDQIVQSERLRALGQMASGITHDFNNALTPILGYSDLLINSAGILDDRKMTLSMLNDIRLAAMDAAQTVRRLSEFYAPARKTERKPIEIGKLIESAVGLTRPLWKEEMSAGGVHINVATRFDDHGNIFGNESQLREMLTNLIFNAVEAMPKGGTLTIRVHREAPLLIINLIDTGTGMTEEALRRCFEPFFTTKHKRGGGLGLAMVHGIVRQHEGTIDIQSIEGKGTTVSIRLPESTATATVEQKQAFKKPEIGHLKVLLIDDEELIGQTIEACLKGDKHEVSIVTDGNKGIELFRSGHFDIVITDRAMPGMSGDHVATEIKKIRPDTPVIMLTGFGHIMKDLAQRPAGVDLIVSKPITRDLLRDSIAKAISHKKHTTGK